MRGHHPPRLEFFVCEELFENYWCLFVKFVCLFVLSVYLCALGFLLLKYVHCFMHSPPPAETGESSGYSRLQAFKVSARVLENTLLLLFLLLLLSSFFYLLISCIFQDAGQDSGLTFSNMPEPGLVSRPDRILWMSKTVCKNVSLCVCVCVCVCVYVCMYVCMCVHNYLLKTQPRSHLQKSHNC